jgi:hypothetical protein
MFWRAKKVPVKVGEADFRTAQCAQAIASTPAERAMMTGLARVIQRISSSAPLRYLSEDEVANSSSMIASRYRFSRANSRWTAVPARVGDFPLS